MSHCSIVSQLGLGFVFVFQRERIVMFHASVTCASCKQYRAPYSRQHDYNRPHLLEISSLIKNRLSNEEQTHH